MWCGQHPAEGCCLQPARECGWFLQYQLKTGALPSSSEPCPGEGSRHRVSALMPCAIPCTDTHPDSPSRAFPNVLECFKEDFFLSVRACLSSRPSPGGQASPSYQPQK